jgi:hypothetical protein
MRKFDALFARQLAAGDLVEGFTVDPANPVQGGVGSDSRLVLIQRTDMATYVRSGLDVVTAITLVANKTGRVFEGIKQSLKPKWTGVDAESGQKVYSHELEYKYFSYTQRAKNNVVRKGNGRYVGIIENTKWDANTIEIYGLDVGMEVVEVSRANQELGGAILIRLRSPEKEYEAKPPATFDAGTGVYATNRTAIDALCFLPTIGVGGLSIVTYAAVTPTAIVITGTNYFANSANSSVLRVDLINNDTGSVIPFTAALTVTNTTITTTTPATGEGAGKNYKVRVTTTQGAVLSAQNIITT